MESSPFKYDIFISFADEDVALARDSANRLKACGMNVFFSKETLRTKVGQQYVEEIFDAMRSSEHMLLIVSESMLQSKWVKREYQTFFNTISILSDDKRRILIYYTDTSFDINKLPLYLQNYQVANVFDDILASLGKSPEQSSSETKVEILVEEKKSPEKKEKKSSPSLLETINDIDMFLMIDGQEQNYSGWVECYEKYWEFKANNFTRLITTVVEVGDLNYKQNDWVEIIHLIDGARNYCYLRSEDPELQLKLFKLALLLKADFKNDPMVKKERSLIQSEKQQQQTNNQTTVTNTAPQKGRFLGSYSDIFYRHWDERSIAFGVQKSSNVVGVFNVYSNCFEFVSSEFNFTVFNINNIYFLNQNAEYVNNYIRVDYLDIAANQVYILLFYRFTFFGDSPTQKMYNEIANLYHQGQLLFEGRV